MLPAGGYDATVSSSGSKKMSGTLPTEFGNLKLWKYIILRKFLLDNNTKYNEAKYESFLNLSFHDYLHMMILHRKQQL